ncbi:MAG TPA: hypothetical protein VK854_07585 [Woeseiaceae bacterium]|nr:hypothetical protein [Woeseiaceae bacterium]
MLTHFILLPGLYFVFTEVDRLRIHAEPALAVLTVQQGGRTLVNMPELEFRLSISPHCARNGQPESLSITIADTQRTLRREALQSATSIEVSMRVSANQLAPFAMRGFCVDPASEGRSMLLRAPLAAQASLRCTRDEQQSIVFAAEPLDIRVDCLRSAATAEPARD